MGKVSFSTFSQASSFARDQAREFGRTVSIERDGDNWVVEGSQPPKKRMTRKTSPKAQRGDHVEENKKDVERLQEKAERIPAEMQASSRARVRANSEEERGTYQKKAQNDSGPSSNFDIIDSAKRKIQAEITSIENREDLSDDEKRSKIIHYFSVICAAIAVQPIPFADIFVLTPVQAYMGERLSAIRGMPLSAKEAKDLVKEIAGVVGLGMTAQQIVLGLYKTGLPFIAGVTTIPLVYGLTYAMGRVMDLYLEKKARGQALSQADIKSMWEKARAEGKKKAKGAREEVMKAKDEL